MMKTITVVSHVSFQVGQVTFEVSRRTSRKNWITPLRRTVAGRSLPALSAVYFVASAKSNVRSIVNWQEWRDSNPRPTVLETAALPTELHSFRQKPTRLRAFWLASADRVLRRGSGCLSAEPLPRKVNSAPLPSDSRSFGHDLRACDIGCGNHEPPRPDPRRLARAFPCPARCPFERRNLVAPFACRL